MNVGEQVVSCLSLYVQVGNMKEANRASIWVVALGGLEVN
jgi:hypothetical protein